MLHNISCILILLLLISCNLWSETGLNDEHPGDEYVIWVEQTFAGGEQCNPENNYVPPDTEEFLQSHGIAVYDTDIEHLGTCAACSCPAYAAIHFALIHTDQKKAAKLIGFELSDGPNR